MSQKCVKNASKAILQVLIKSNVFLVGLKTAKLAPTLANVINVLKDISQVRMLIFAMSVQYSIAKIVTVKNWEHISIF